MLFYHFISDLGENIKLLIKFADSTKIGGEVHNDEGTWQSGGLGKMGIVKRHGFNTAKCWGIYLGRKHAGHVYRIQNCTGGKQ